jgi:hypothetical protein
VKKLLLTGIAVLFLTTGASAQEGTPPPLGWVYSKYVDCPDGHPGHGCYIVRTDDTANVRQHPNGPILSSLGKGTRVIPLDWNGSWVLVAVRIYQRNPENAQVLEDPEPEVNINPDKKETGMSDEMLEDWCKRNDPNSTAQSCIELKSKTHIKQECYPKWVGLNRC